MNFLPQQFFVNNFPVVTKNFLISFFSSQFPFKDSICQQFMPNNKNINNKRRKQNCNYQDLWLIPGKADASCSKNCVKIRPSIIKFPGCFTVEIRNIHIVDNNG
ncbi:unnamed protein product [Meloidogyne enterolobii]|uniref:Uncharacterized protein n=1 Tax=Meloidogyne enterolobii TaxID=390850 RepID=A0ACB0YCH7_MELEN